jgi:uncharacterized membrane protein (UPF0136 family)
MNCAYHGMNRAVVRCNSCARLLCPACDHRIRGFPFCQDCIVAGVEMLQQHQSRVANAAPPQSTVRHKNSPTVALLLSFLVPGLGAAYNGQTSKALVHFAIFAGFFQMAIITDGLAFFVLGIGGALLFAAIDAYRTAQLIRSGLAPDAEADAIARRLYGNPLAWGMMLVALGAIFLLHTVFGIQINVRQFLPAVLIALGGYMLYDFLSNRKRRAGASFDALRPPPSVVSASGSSTPLGVVVSSASTSPSDAVFRTGELVTQVSARDNRPPTF